MLAASVTERRNTIPILSSILFEARGGRGLTVTGTDMEIQLSVDVEGVLDGTFPRITAPASRVASLLHHLAPEDTVTLSRAEEGQIVVAADNMAAKLYSLPAEDFPTFSAIEAKARWSTTANELRQLFDRTAHAISREETRYYLNGVYLHAREVDGAKALYAAATDGHRLMRASIPLPEGDEPPAMIWPRKTVDRLRQILARSVPTKPLAFLSDGVRVAIDGGAWRLASKMIDGTFPNYERVIPPDDGEPITVLDSKLFAAAISTVTSISGERSRPVKLHNGSGATLRLNAASAEQGICDLTVPAAAATWSGNGEHPEIGFQARYMLDLCKVFAGGFTMRVKKDQPATVTGAEGLAVLMPMRV